MLFFHSNSHENEYSFARKRDCDCLFDLGFADLIFLQCSHCKILDFDHTRPSFLTIVGLWWQTQWRWSSTSTLQVHGGDKLPSTEKTTAKKETRQMGFTGESENFTPTTRFPCGGGFGQQKSWSRPKGFQPLVEIMDIEDGFHSYFSFQSSGWCKMRKLIHFQLSCFKLENLLLFVSPLLGYNYCFAVSGGKTDTGILAQQCNVTTQMLILCTI